MPLDLKAKWHGAPVWLWIGGGTTLTAAGIIVYKRRKAAKAAAAQGLTSTIGLPDNLTNPIPGWGGTGLDSGAGYMAGGGSSSSAPAPPTPISSSVPIDTGGGSAPIDQTQPPSPSPSPVPKTPGPLVATVAPSLANVSESVASALGTNYVAPGETILPPPTSVPITGPAVSSATDANGGTVVYGGNPIDAAAVAASSVPYTGTPQPKYSLTSNALPSDIAFGKTAEGGSLLAQLQQEGASLTDIVSGLQDYVNTYSGQSGYVPLTQAQLDAWKAANGITV